MSNAAEKWLTHRRFNPIKEFAPLQDSIDRLFNEFSSFKAPNGLQDLSYSPSCEIVEDEKNYLLKFDLPGVPKEQVKVELDGNQIIVRAERSEEKKSDSKKKHFSEMYYGSYMRSFTLPSPLNEKQVDAKFENGVLTVTIPKIENPKSKQIAVH